MATQYGAIPKGLFLVIKSTTLNNKRRNLRSERCILEGVRRFLKSIDIALPRSYIREIYKKWLWRERSALTWLRIDIAKLNGYLHRIKVVPLE